MFEIFQGKKAAQYIFFEMLPSFLMGVLVFVSIILMFQVLRLTDFALSHGVSLTTIGEILSYITISMLPALLPMALLFSVLLTYGRLSADSEIVAMKASGLHMATILLPALILGLVVSIISAQTSFQIAPWGNRQFEVLFSKVGSTKAGISIKEGTFSEGFFEMVVYANKVNSETGELENVFIYDEAASESAITIIAKKGKIIPDPENPGHDVLLRLQTGDIHRSGEAHTKIKFDSYDIHLRDPLPDFEKKKSPQSWTLSEIEERLKDPSLSAKDIIVTQSEFHKRWAISVLCLIFAMLGVGLGTTTNKRAAKAGGMILSVILIVTYWILYISFEGFARSGKLPPAIGIWTPNILFSLFALYSLKKNWN
ncbi:MAG: LPS export ABC transporter permease LptF [Bdellovibrionia bacterium]